MRQVFAFIAVLAAIVATPFQARAAGPWDVHFRNIKLPSQAMLERDKWASPALGTTTLVLANGVAASSGVNTFTSFAAQPDYPRNITITPGGASVNMPGGTAVVTGTNFYGKTITENFTINSGSTATVTGAKAFKAVTSVSFPASTGAGVLVSVGTGAKLGISKCLDDAGKYVFSEFNNVYDTTRGTAAVSATAVESNTFQSNTTLNASPVELFYVQNFRCFGN